MQYETTFDRKTGLFDTHRADLQAIANDFARGQALAIQLSREAAEPAKCPGYGCFNVLGPDSGIIDGDRYCAECVAAEAREAGREVRRQDAELFARGGGDL